MEVQTVQQLNIAAIKPDPNQPRKTFNDKSLKLLSESIVEHGVLQPITVRVNGKGHIIVMGERRYRASKLAKLKTIPCIIRDFDSNVVSEVQIIENLQRQDVEPIEEAEAIALLLKKYPAEEIATRIGRTVQFIYGRIKLANLIEGFRPYVRSKEMTLSMAITVAIFPKEDQELFLEAMGDSFHAYYINNGIKDKMFDLNEAPFDLTDEKLVPKAGACTLCPFNSANEGNLFGNDKKVCTKSSCFTSKKSKALLATITKAKEEKKLLVADFRKYYLDSERNQLIFSLMNENGLIPYHADDIESIEKPVKPTMESVKEQMYDESTVEEIKAELEEDINIYNNELKEYEDGPDNGFAIGLLLDTSTYKTKEVLMKIAIKNASSSIGQDSSLAKKKMDDCTPKEKIEKINSREIRKKEIEDNKQFEEVMHKVRETDYIDTKKALSLDEMVAFSISMHENLLGYHERGVHFKSFYGKNIKSNEKCVEHFKKNFNKETFNKLIRILLVQNVHFTERNHHNDITNNSMYTALRTYCKKEMESIEDTYAKTRKLREEKLKARITELEGQLAEK